MTNTDCEELIPAIKRRERPAWAGFYDRHVREVYGFICHLVQGNHTVAEELNQEVWLAAMNHIDRYDPAKGTLRSWILGIARNKVALYFRSTGGNKWAAAVEMADVVSGLNGHPVLPPDCVAQHERASLVRAALAALPLDRRDVLNGKYVEGLSVKQLADRTGKTTKAVESLLSRARGQLRQLLNGLV